MLVSSATIILAFTVAPILNMQMKLLSHPVDNYKGKVHIRANTPFSVNTNVELKNCNLVTLPVDTDCDIYSDSDTMYLNLATY